MNSDNSLYDFFMKNSIIRPDYYKNCILNSTCSNVEETITAEKILKDMYKAMAIIDANKQKILYYAVSKMIEKGKVLHMNKTDLNPEYIVFNRDDFEENKEEILKLNFLLPISNKERIKQYEEKLDKGIKWYNIGE